MEKSDAQATGNRSHGTVNGRQARFCYDQTSGSHGSFTYQYEREDDAFCIDGDRIVVIVLADQESSEEEFTLFYVDVAPDSADADSETTSKLVSITIVHPPVNIIQDFSPEPVSWWNSRPSSDYLHIIISGGSGRGHAEACFHNLVEPFLRARSCDFTVHRTSSSSSITELAQNAFLPAAKARAPKMIVMLSGDGGVVDLVNGLIPPGPETASSLKSLPSFVSPKLVLLPLGTGNALAHSSGITADRTMGMSTLARGNPRRLPLFSVHFDPPARSISQSSKGKENVSSAADTQDSDFCHGAVVFSWGLHASLVADSDTPEYRKLGSERFQVAAKENLFPADGSQSHAYQGSLSVMKQDPASDRTILGIQRDTHSYILATFCSQLEKGFCVSPNSKPLDGQLRVVHFGSKKGEDAMRIMQLAYEGGKHVNDPEVGYDAIKGLKLMLYEKDDERWRRICVDGKIFVCPPGGWVDVQAERESVLEIFWLDRLSEP